MSIGKTVIFCDADGASRFSDIELLEEGIKKSSVKGFGIATGCRSGNTDSIDNLEEPIVKVNLIVDY